MNHKRAFFVTASSCLLAAPLAHSQTTDAPRADRLEEIVVTAERRAVNLQEVPVSVTAFGDEARQILGLDTLQDYANFTPGLTFSPGNDRVFIRGIGRQTNTNGSDPGVATYSDGVYNASTASASVSDFFIERVEILRGPQGTLYGRNSIGGAINAISKRPTESFFGEVRGTFANYDTQNLEAAVSGTVVDGLRLRLAGARYRQGDGYFKNVAGGPDEGGVSTQRYLELQAEADISERTSLWLKAFSTRTTSRPRSTNSVGPYDYAPFPTAAIIPGSGFGFTQPDFEQLGSATVNPGIENERHFSTNSPSRSRLRDNLGISSQIVWHLESVDVSLIGGWQTYLFESTFDLDNTSVTSYTFPLNESFNTCAFIPGCTPLRVFPSQRFNNVEDKTFYSGELTISSVNESNLQWIAGAYYFFDDLHQESHFNAPDQPELRAPANGPPNDLGNFVFAASTLDTESYAVFGQADWRITDTISLTGGLRYTRDKKSGFEELRVVCLGCSPAFLPGDFGSFTPPLDVTASTASFSPAPGVRSETTVDPDTGNAHRRLGGTWDAITGTAGIQWQPDGDTLGFLRYSRGYKSGGFNAGGISQFPETDAEYVDAIELGYKRTFGDRVQLNGALFYYWYDGLQIPLTVEENGINITRFFNLDESVSYGLELEAVWWATDSLRFMGSYGLGLSRINDACCFVDGADPEAIQPGARPVGPMVGGQQPQDLRGADLPQTPRHKFALNAAYNVDFNLGTLTLSANYIWRDETYHSVFNRPYTLAPSYGQVDLRMVWTGHDDRYRVIGYVRNLFDEKGYHNASGTLRRDPAGVVAQSYGFTPPRTFGLQLQYRL